MTSPIELKNIEVEKIDGEEKIRNRDFPTNHKSGYVSAKHTYIKCNACGKKFSLNYADKNFESAKLLALKAKWKHAEKEHHHQEETLYFGEEEVKED